MAGIWSKSDNALPADPPGALEVVDGPPDGAKIPELEGMPSAFTPDYAPEEMFPYLQTVQEIAITELAARHMDRTCRASRVRNVGELLISAI